jgi:excisionase family DNA binding protein
MAQKVLAQQLQLEVIPIDRPEQARAGHKRTPPQKDVRPRLALSPDEAAAALGVSRDYLDEHVIGELRLVRRGRRILIPLVELERWLQESGVRGVL